MNKERKKEKLKFKEYYKCEMGQISGKGVLE
jgi:hypothetical protein